MTKTVLATLAALALGSAARADALAAPAQGTSIDKALEAQIQPAVREFSAAWNSHDPRAMAATFADDAVLINPQGRVAQGRAEIEKLFQDEHTRGPLKTTRYTSRLTGLRQIAPGILFMDEEITLAGQDAHGNTLPSMEIHGAMVLSNQSGKWQVIEARPYGFAPPAKASNEAHAAAPLTK